MPKLFLFTQEVVDRMKSIRISRSVRVSLATGLTLAAVFGTACSQRAGTTSKPLAAAPTSDAATADPATAPEATENDAPAEDHKNTIRWTTASEVENSGFNVYRGNGREGPFERLNEDIIEGGYTTDEPQSYSFVDRDIDPYRSYFYYVESVSLSGIRETFTPIIEARPKLERDPQI